jgi:hypothetical protein
MRPLTPAPVRPTRRDPEPPPEGGLKVFLWVIAVLIASLELAWWMFDRMFSQ